MRKFIVILAGLAVLFTGCKKDNPEVTGSISLSQDMVQVNGLSEDYFVFVDNAARTIEIEIAYADVNELAALEVEFVNLPQGVTAEGFTCDFTATPSRLVSFSDGSVEVQYTVTAEAADPDPHFTSLTVNGVAAANNEVKLSGGSDLANAVVEFTVSPEGTKVMVGDQEIESGATVDFSDKVNGVTFTLVCGEITNTDKYVAVTTGINNVVRVWGHYAAPVTVTDDWFGTEMPAASGDWMRNIAMDNQYVYMPHASGAGGVYAVNVSDGKLAKAMSTTGIAGGVHLTSDAEVMDNGSSTILLVCNLANNAAGNLTVYAYDNVDAAPRVVLNYSLANATPTPRLGDKMTAEGTWEKGKLYFFDYNNATERRVFAFSIENGVIDPNPEIISLGAAVTGNSISGIYKYSDTEYIWMGTAGHAKVYSVSNGTFTESCFLDDGSKWSFPEHGARFFSFNDESYMAFVTLANAYQDGDLRIVPVAGQSLADALAATDQSAGRVLGLGDPVEHGITALKNANGAGDSAMRTINGEIYIAAAVPGTGISLFKIE